MKLPNKANIADLVNLLHNTHELAMMTQNREYYRDVKYAPYLNKLYVISKLDGYLFLAKERNQDQAYAWLEQLKKEFMAGE